MTAKQLEEMAMNGNFSQFEGQENFEGDYYDGRNDDFVEFGGAIKSFLEKQKGNNRIFTMKIENQSVGLIVRNIILMPAYTPEGRAAGSIVVTDGTIVIGAGEQIVSSGTPKLIQNFLDFIKFNPTIILGFKVRAKVSATQLEEVVTVRELSPFKTLESYEISLSAYQDEDTFQDKVVSVPEEIIASNQTEVSIPLNANETITISWFAGAILNTAVACQRKWGKAKYTSAAAKSLLASN